VPALAAAWTLSVEGVTGAICGARRPDQVRGWIAAGDVALAPEDVRPIEAALASAGIGGTR
jgi:aryl-alcohol dehydrogenase-like predicted oxidoreductase